MSETVLESLARALDTAAISDGNVYAPPVALLWPDKARQWEGSIESLRKCRNVLVLGSYDSGNGTGPAIWLRCAVAGAIEDDGSRRIPVVYLPGVSRDDLRTVAAEDQRLAPLASLQHRSEWFTQPNGKEWTVRGLLANKERGLGLNVAADEATADALVAGLDYVIHEPLARLEDKHIDAAFVHGLLNPDPVRLLLRWIDTPTTVQGELGAAAWQAFVAQCRSNYGVNPATAGVIEGALRLGTAEGAWYLAWLRYRESPSEYPNIPGRLRDARPMELFTSSNLAWPQDNEAAEDRLRSRLRDLPALTVAGARNEIGRLEQTHRERRGSVWAQLGRSPLALALEHLADVAARCQPSSTDSSVEQLCNSYAAEGWRTDLAVLRSLAEVDQERDVQAVSAALDSVYRPWLDQAAKALQNAVGPEANSGAYAVRPAPMPNVGEVVVFVDGMRLDIAHLLAERLEDIGATVQLEIGLAALPTVTQTAKPALVPIDQSLLAPGQALDACRASSGASAGVQVLRSLLNEAGVQVLVAQETGQPSGIAWTETGRVDHMGHELGARLAREMSDETAKIARRIRDLIDAGWSKVTVVTDHGWLLLPSGLPKNDSLPVAATVTKKGRCARVKDGASIDVPTVPWHWDNNVRIAVAPGISCFEANKVYEHGGVSLQECVVPRLTVTAAVTAPVTRAEITSIKWRGLTLVVEFADLPDGATVDLRRHAGDAATSAAVARVTGGTGKVILLVENEDLEGTSAQLVVVAADGTVLLQRETSVGYNR